MVSVELQVHLLGPVDVSVTPEEWEQTAAVDMLRNSDPGEIEECGREVHQGHGSIAHGATVAPMGQTQDQRDTVDVVVHHGTFVGQAMIAYKATVVRAKEDGRALRQTGQG